MLPYLSHSKTQIGFKARTDGRAANGLSTTGEMTTLMNLLAEDVTFWGDGGGKVKGAATHPITGRVAVARFFLATGNVFRRSLPKDSRVELAEVNHQPARLSILPDTGGECKNDAHCGLEFVALQA